MVLRLRQSMQIELALMQLFQSPVLAELADAIVQAELRRFGSGEIDQAQAELAGLSEAELDALLAEERKLSLK